MKRTLLRTAECAILLLTVIAYCRPAHAYVDMGTGSYIVQVSIAAVAGALFWLKMCWSGIRAKFRPAPRAEKSPTVATVSSASADGE